VGVASPIQSASLPYPALRDVLRRVSGLHRWRKRPAINEAVFPAIPSIQYWTSTASGPSYAWVVFFRTGMPTWNFLKTATFAVRMVRSGR
jgi:hypothetical protein